MKRIIGFIFMVSFLFGGVGCSTQKDRFLNREYHALNTKYNVLFNGNEALSIGGAILNQNAQDDFLSVLPVEPIVIQGEDELEEATIPSFALAEEKAVKAIQKHSMNFDGVQKNREVQKAYLLLGKARYYDRRFLPAIEAFNFLLEEYIDNSIYYEGKLWREKTNLRLRNNELAISNLRPLAQNLIENQPLYGQINATVAQAFYNIKEEDSARIYIHRAAKAEKDKIRQTRYRYIEGQLLERAQHLDSARKAFQSIVEQKRKVPREFWMQAKLQSVRLTALLDSQSPIPVLERLGKIFENQAFRHLIFQQQARYLLEQKEDSIALEYYQKSLASPNINSATRQANYRDLADHYFEQGKYVLTGAYLDSLLLQITQEGRRKKAIQKERKGLDEVIALENTIKLTDSVLFLSSLTKKQQLAFFKKTIEDKREEEIARVEANKKKGFLKFAGNRNSTFYFYNEQIRVLGKQEFLSTWGDRPNVDNWNRLSNNNVTYDEIAGEQIDEEDTKAFIVETPAFYVSKIPTDPKVLDTLRSIRKQAYLDVGIIYKEKFSNHELALDRLRYVLENKPTQYQEVSALYHSFKLLEKKQPENAEELRQRLIKKFPDSPFSQILLDPTNFELTDNQRPAMIYERLYKAFQNQEYEEIIKKGESFEVMVSGTPLEPKLALLIVHAKGRLKGSTHWIELLKEYVNRFPNTDEASQIREILTRKPVSSPESKPSLKSYKWVFVLPRNVKAKDLKKAIEAQLDLEKNNSWKVSLDVYDHTFNFLVIHTSAEYPDQDYFINQWKDFPNFEKVQNNFVILSDKYQEFQQLKSWSPVSSNLKQ